MQPFEFFNSLGLLDVKPDFSTQQRLTMLLDTKKNNSTDYLYFCDLVGIEEDDVQI